MADMGENVKVFFHTVVSGIEKNQTEIISVNAVSYDRTIKLKFSSLIDCSGDALLSLMSEASVIESDLYQASAQVFGMEGLEIESELNLNFIILKEIQKAISEGYLSKDYFNVSVVPGSLRGNKVYLKIGLPTLVNNELNKITPLEFTARKMVFTISEFLKETTVAFKNAKLSDVASEAGVRTGRRHKGKTILTKKDVLSCSKLTHSAARGAWPIEFWELGKRVKLDFFEFDDYYDIPLDCLVSCDVENLFFAGRNISATEEAIASARVIGTCMQTGCSAGELAVNNLTR